MISLDSEKIEDPAARENFEKISESLNGNALFGGQFKSIEIDVTDTSRPIKVPHGLRFRPTDLWTSWVTNGAAITIFHAQIDDEFFAFQSTAVCKVRFIIGRIE